ncbi:leukotriene A-4 hydrolase-like isoform X2 [Belonocnema kinseyi]|uniref:leukotriene A-4 hydrolase-like isoform X2 n=1 Tax=Belonocnema kinseyi TaxID=2817044 RepID=UPI00143DA7AA|nr:leukotriene A-4 hydrolase-like isoform X2 [Belonocnema kinseyi]
MLFFLFLSLLLKFVFVSEAFQNPKMVLSPNDPSSFSRPELVAVVHTHLQLSINFEKKILEGRVILDAVRKNNSADVMILDVKDLTLINVTNGEDDSKLEYTVGETVSFGSKLSIKLPNVSESDDGKTRYKIKIQYQTSSKATALMWLEAKQTSGGKHPYLFSQSEAIHARTMLPCQDTPGLKSTYSAEITAPKWATVLMSVGSLVSKRVGPRSSVWAEEELIEQSAYEFAETETMLQTAEEICGPYIWGIYDLLVLPPSFAYGGMENPCLTFVTPTLLAGDRSAVSVIAHEIAHSWSGNLVTNANFEHFWLNEGFTFFIQFKIDGRMFGEKVRQFDALIGLSELNHSISTSETPERFKLIVNLDGINPDDADVPYMKGHALLYYLEELLGGPKEFEAFLKSYFNLFKCKSVLTSDWKGYLYKYFSNKTELLDSVDWDTWLNKPGMPPVIPNYNTDLLNACIELAKRWLSWDENSAPNFEKSDIMNLRANQRIQFLKELFRNETVLSIKKLEKMQEIYDFDSVQNVEIKFMWIRLALKSRWEVKVAEALDFVSKVGRMGFASPIYSDFYAWEEMRQRAIDNYTKTKDRMMYVTAEKLKKVLHLDDN